MVRDYLNTLKSRGNFSWSELSSLSGLPDATIRKIFSGETADPRLDTVTKLVIAMGGSMNELVSIKEKNDDHDEEDIQMNAITAIQQVYEARISDLKETNAEHTNSLKKDKHYLAITVCILGAVLLLFLLMDLLMGSVGWIRY